MSEVIIGKNKLEAHINDVPFGYEIEVPFFEKWDEVSTVTVNGEKCTMLWATDVGGRSEVIRMQLDKPKGDNNEHKQVKSRKDTSS